MGVLGGLPPTRDHEDDTKCACWTPCAKVAEIMGFAAGKDLAGNGTQFKALCIDTEHVGRFVADHYVWLESRGIESEHIPLRVARSGSWPDAAAYVDDAREARRCVIRFIAETKLVINQLRDIFAALDSASASGGVDAVFGVLDTLDKRKRGRGDQLKLPFIALSEEDKAFARELLPVTQCRGRIADDARRVLSGLHSLRTLVWPHTNELFPGRAVLNSPVVLNVRTKWSDDKERRLHAAERILESIERSMKNVPTDFIGSNFVSPAHTASLGLAACTPPSVASAAFIPTEPAHLELTPFCDPAPALLVGRFTARHHRAPCEAAMRPPEVFELCERVPADPKAPIPPRCQGLTVHDTVGQWVQAPGDFCKSQQNIRRIGIPMALPGYLPDLRN